jgi:hypothetical protein
MSHDAFHVLLASSEDADVAERGGIALAVPPAAAEDFGVPQRGMLKPAKKKPWKKPTVILSEITQDTAHGVGGAADGASGTAASLNHS